MAAPAPILSEIMCQYSVPVSYPSERLYVGGAVALHPSSGKVRRDIQAPPDDCHGTHE